MAFEGEVLARTSRIDPKLKASLWTLVPPKKLERANTLRAERHADQVQPAVLAKACCSEVVLKHSSGGS
jgi:hypothetical protein